MKTGFRIKTEKYIIKQRGGESPDIQVTRRQYIPIRRYKPQRIKVYKVIECIKTDSGELCTGNSCSLFKKCFPKKAKK